MRPSGTPGPPIIPRGAAAFVRRGSGVPTPEGVQAPPQPEPGAPGANGHSAGQPDAGRDENVVEGEFSEA